MNHNSNIHRIQRRRRWRCALLAARCPLHDKRGSFINDVGSMTVAPVREDGVIFVSLHEGDKLYFKNSGGIIDNSSEIALYSLETQTLHQHNVAEHQTVSIHCSVLNTTADDAGVLRHFFIPAGKAYNNIQFNKLYFKPVRKGWGHLQELYFECSNKVVVLKHITLLHRRHG